jgi:TonB-linked SusC/RagA family outer membrane protein
MRLIVFLFFISLIHVSASVYSQKTKLNVKLLNVSLTDVFKVLQEQSEFDFFYKNEQIPTDAKISIEFKNEKIEVILDEILAGTGLIYHVLDKDIVITSNQTVKGELSSQQQKSVSGKVTDSSGSPLPGVTIVAKGTTIGIITDMNGNYLLTKIPENATLQFSFVGMKTQEVAIGNNTTINITLVDEAIGIDEVVAVGYGVQRKSDLTGAVGSIKAEKLRDRPATTVSQAIAGRMSGVNVSVNSGRPGGKPNIRIRGNSSISITNEPLYIVDGVISSIDYVNPNDIASIEVLKDASSTSIYGARGSNGVVLVSTKRGGGVEGSKVNFESEFSIGQLSRRIDYLSSEEVLKVEDTAYLNAQKFDPSGWAVGKYKDPKLKRTDPRLFDGSGNPLFNTDWQKETTQSAFSHNQNLSFTGGDAKTSFGMYLGYKNEEGLIKTSYLKRYTGRFVVDSQINKWLKVGGSLSYTNQDENRVDETGASIDVIRSMAESWPIFPVKFADGNWANGDSYPNIEMAPNPIQLLTEVTMILKTQSVLGSMYANFNLAKGLEFRTMLGTNVMNQRSNRYAGNDVNYAGRSQKGVAAVTDTDNSSWNFENYLTYNKKITDVHSITALLGASWQHADYYNFGATTWGFQDNFYLTNNLSAGSNPQPSTSSTSAFGLNSYFSRINYALKDKYLLTVTGRADGSSKFGASNRYAFFPSAAFGWKASEEDFIKSIQEISKLKLRSSYGYTGNSEIQAYQALSGLGSYSTIFNDTRASGTGVGRLPNSGLQWEKTAQADIGLELGLFKNRISFEIDLYRKLTTNMLLAAPVPTTSGYSSVTENIGSMENKGIEFDLNTVNIRLKDFSWNTTFNISINKNEVVKLGVNNADVFPGPSYVSETNIARVGESMGSFYGYVRLGTWGTAEVAEAAKYLKKPGDLKMQDTNGDGKINTLDRVIIGKGIPDGFGSLINTLSYKDFDLSLDLQFMYGNDILVLSTITQEGRTGLASSRATVLNAWTPENQNTDIAQLRHVSAGYDLFQDTRMVKDGSFIRGRNLLLAYNFSPELVKKLKVSKLRLTGSIQNLFLLTSYKGYDPEVSSFGSGSTFAQGIVAFNGDYPKPRVFTLGLSVSF